MSNTEDAIAAMTARELSDLGEPPADPRRKAEWVRSQFFQLGAVWYRYAVSDRARAQELEDVAAELLQAHPDHLPSLSTLKRDVANYSFLPSTVEQLWTRAFPPTARDRAQSMHEWRVIDGVHAKLVELRDAGRDAEAEALRGSAISFFNKYLNADEVGAEVRKKMRKDLAKDKPAL